MDLHCPYIAPVTAAATITDTHSCVVNNAQRTYSLCRPNKGALKTSIYALTLLHERQSRDYDLRMCAQTWLLIIERAQPIIRFKPYDISSMYNIVYVIYIYFAQKGNCIWSGRTVKHYLFICMTIKNFTSSNFNHMIWERHISHASLPPTFRPHTHTRKQFERISGVQRLRFGFEFLKEHMCRRVWLLGDLFLLVLI